MNGSYAELASRGSIAIISALSLIPALEHEQGQLAPATLTARLAEIESGAPARVTYRATAPGSQPVSMTGIIMGTNPRTNKFDLLVIQPQEAHDGQVLEALPHDGYGIIAIQTLSVDQVQRLVRPIQFPGMTSQRSQQPRPQQHQHAAHHHQRNFGDDDDDDFPPLATRRTRASRATHATHYVPSSSSDERTSDSDEETPFGHGTLHATQAGTRRARSSNYHDPAAHQLPWYAPFAPPHQAGILPPPNSAHAQLPLQAPTLQSRSQLSNDAIDDVFQCLSVPIVDVPALRELFRNCFVLKQVAGERVYTIVRIPSPSHYRWRGAAFILPTWLFIAKTHFVEFFKNHVATPLQQQLGRHQFLITHEAQVAHAALVDALTHNSAADSVQNCDITNHTLDRITNAIAVLQGFYTARLKLPVLTKAAKGRRIDADDADIDVPQSMKTHVKDALQKADQAVLVNAAVRGNRGGNRGGGAGGAAAWQQPGNGRERFRRQGNRRRNKDHFRNGYNNRPHNQQHQQQQERNDHHDSGAPASTQRQH
jgi:hypothetical protein